MSRFVHTDLFQVSPASVYEKGPGFVIEARFEQVPSGWAIPDWEEWSMPHFEGVFATEAEAQKIIDDEMDEVPFP